MGTAITPTLTAGPANGPRGLETEFTLALDTTTGAGLQTLDLTAYYGYLHSVDIVGSLAATGYYVEVQKPALATALSSTNLVLGFYEAGADGAALDPIISTDISAVITGLTIRVVGKPAAVTSWA